MLCSADPAAFRANLQEHVHTMALLGFNVYALGILATRDIYLFIGTPDALSAHVAMLRNFFRPWGDELAIDISQTKITSLCLPAVALDTMHVSQHSAATTHHKPISQLHKAVLAGPLSLLKCTPARLEEQMRTLVAAGLCATEEDARRQSMQRFQLLLAHTPEWYLERKAAVLGAGGDDDDVHAACCRTQSLRVMLARPPAVQAGKVRCQLVLTRGAVQHAVRRALLPMKHDTPERSASVQGSVDHPQRTERPWLQADRNVRRGRREAQQAVIQRVRGHRGGAIRAARMARAYPCSSPKGAEPAT